MLSLFLGSALLQETTMEMKFGTENQRLSLDGEILRNQIFSLLENHFLFGLDADKDLDAHIRGKVRVLSIDGGGVQSGMLAAKTLMKVEEALQRKTGDRNARIADYFDVASGTGVGGIIAAMLFADDGNGRPLYRAEDTWRLFTDNNLPRILGKHSSTGSSVVSKLLGRGNCGRKMERLLRSLFTDANGRNLTLKDTVKPLLIPCYDLSSGAPFLFSRADALETDNFDFRLFEICRATSASPGLFKPVVVRSTNGRTVCTAIDGRVVMSNPATAAITHVLHNKHEFPLVNGLCDLLVLSVGAGLAERSYEDRHVRNWDAGRWTKPMLELVGEGISETVDHCLSLAFVHNPQNYVRIQAFGVPSEAAEASEDSVRKSDGVDRESDEAEVRGNGALRRKEKVTAQQLRVNRRVCRERGKRAAGKGIADRSECSGEAGNSEDIRKWVAVAVFLFGALTVELNGIFSKGTEYTINVQTLHTLQGIYIMY